MTTSSHLLKHSDPQGPPKHKREALVRDRPTGLPRENHLPARRDLRVVQRGR